MNHPKEDPNAMLQRIINLLPIRIFWKDRNLKFLGCNRIFAMDAGMEKPEDLIGKDDYDMGWMEQAHIYREDDMRVMKSGIAKLDFEEPQTTPDGRRIWLRTNKVPLTDDSGKTIGILGMYEDITEKKLAEERLVESEQRFRQMFESISNCVAIYQVKDDGDDFIIRDFNPAAEKAEKVSKESIIGKSVLQAFPGVKEFGLFDVFRRVWKTGKAEAFPISRYEDNRIAGWRDNFVYKLGNGDIVAVYEDVTEQKQAEESLKILGERYQAIMKYSKDRVFMIDPLLNYAAASDSTASHMGKKPEEIIGKPLQEVFGDTEQMHRFSGNISQVFKTKAGLNLQEEFLLDGKPEFISTELAPIMDAKGEVILVLGMVRDITLIKHDEEELRKSKEILQAKVRELERLNKVFVDRELKMAELKKKMKELEERLAQKGQVGP